VTWILHVRTLWPDDDNLVPALVSLGIQRGQRCHFFREQLKKRSPLGFVRFCCKQGAKVLDVKYGHRPVHGGPPLEQRGLCALCKAKSISAYV
jgi:hypothetical protein